MQFQLLDVDAVSALSDTQRQLLSVMTGDVKVVKINA